MENNNAYVEAQMLIRKPAATVFEAFIDPAVTRHFWFTKSSGKLETGKTITWEWEMYNVSTKVMVKEIIPDTKIAVDWGDPSTAVDFNFQPLQDGSTYVVVREYGFKQTGDDLLAIIRDSTGGFTTVLDGLKAYLEHGIDLNLIGDKFPKEAVKHGK
ncbi:SRPBCC family protein [Chitinophaga sp.]|uniref:SRPBCC family protein n=1 Tax=Chitinophaga sp. TaxID=1869181 RepID=UPI0031E0454D